MSLSYNHQAQFSDVIFKIKNFHKSKVDSLEKLSSSYSLFHDLLHLRGCPFTKGEILEDSIIGFLKLFLFPTSMTFQPNILLSFLMRFKIQIDHSAQEQQYQALSLCRDKKQFISFKNRKILLISPNYNRFYGNLERSLFSVLKKMVVITLFFLGGNFTQFQGLAYMHLFFLKIL